MIPRLKVAIFGAGPVGMSAALCLSKLGHDVQVFEKREDYRSEAFSDKRSINLTLSERGMRVLRLNGLEEQVINHSVGISGREVHRSGRKSFVQFYGSKNKNHLFSVTRKDLIQVIHAGAASSERIIFNFKTTLVKILADDRTCIMTNELGETTSETFDFIIGADGVNSVVRDHVMMRRQGKTESAYFDWGYRSFTLSVAASAQIGLEKYRVHIFGTDEMMIFAFANRDGSFSGNAFTRFESESNFGAFKTAEELSKLIQRNFPDLTLVALDIGKQIEPTQTANVQYSICDKCQSSGRVLLLGDAFRSVYHFYAQGVNAGLEDCLVLNQLLGEEASLEEALKQFEEIRVPISQSLVNLSRNNFYYLKSKANTFLTQSRNKIESLLTSRFPKAWPSAYQLVCNGSVDYQSAELTIKKRNIFWQVALLWIPQFLYSAVLWGQDTLASSAFQSRLIPAWTQARRLSFLIAAALMSILSLILVISSAQSAEIKVGLATNLSEADKTLWNPSRAYIRKATELAIADLGPELKKRDITIKIVPFDIANNAGKAVETIQSIIQSDVASVIGFPKSSDALLAAEAFSKAKLAFVTPSGSAERIASFGAGVKSGGPGTAMQARALVDTVLKRNLKRMGIITVADCAYCQSLRTEIKNELKIKSVTLEFDEVILSNVQRYKATFEKLTQSKVDVIFLPNYEFESSNIINALTGLNIIPKAYVGCTAWADMSTLLGQSLQNQKIESILLALWDRNMKNPYAVNFQKRFSKMFNEEPHDVAALAYNGALISIRAILAAKTLDRAGVYNSLASLRTVPLLTGTSDFGQNQTFSSSPMGVLTFRGSKLETSTMVKIR